LSSKNKVIVTGGSGFIGTNLIELLINQGSEVLNLDINPPRNCEQKKFWLKVNILDLKLLSDVISKFSPVIIYHLAARTDLDGEVIADYDANTIGVGNLIKAVSKNTSLQKVIFASSRLVCKVGYIPGSMEDYCPDTLYGQSKAMGEKIVRAMSSQISCPWIIVRPTSIWGPWFDVPYKNFFLSIYRRQYFHPASMKIKKHFGFVGNTVYQLGVLGGENCIAAHSHTMYLADYDAIDVKEMANIISAEFYNGPIISFPMPVLKSCAYIGDFLKKKGWKNPPLTTFRLNNLITSMEYDLEPLRAVIGPLPYTMHQGIEVTCNWLILSES
jgi:nucleoside-diphosphate-sugar epimerase